ncbi:hypothetical protein NIES2130_00980 [Scytonema sp. HK-05]|nr:hypothetical protein NIES2130_00980 [Scytonema sp. HK-05]
MAAKEPKPSEYTLLGCMQAACKSDHDYDFQVIVALLRINRFFKVSKNKTINYTLTRKYFEQERRT